MKKILSIYVRPIIKSWPMQIKLWESFKRKEKTLITYVKDNNKNKINIKEAKIFNNLRSTRIQSLEQDNKLSPKWTLFEVCIIYLEQFTLKKASFCIVKTLLSSVSSFPSRRVESALRYELPWRWRTTHWMHGFYLNIPTYLKPSKINRHVGRKYCNTTIKKQRSMIFIPPTNIKGKVLKKFLLEFFFVPRFCYINT